MRYLPCEEASEIRTTGEVFSDGTMIELLRDSTEPGRLNLLTWNGAQATVGARAVSKGRVYVPAALHPTILGALRLPTQSAPYGSTRDLTTEVSNVIARFTNLPERSVFLFSGFAFQSWFVDCSETAPHLWIVSPSANLGNQLLRLLACLCRRPLLLGEVSAAGLCSLPMMLRPTVLIEQRKFSAQVERLLGVSNRRNLYVPRSGRLLDLYCAKAIYSAEGLGDTALARSAIRISISPTAQSFPVFDEQVEQQIANEFQAKFLAYRLANHATVRHSDFDVPQFTFPMRELARGLGASIVDDPELQARVLSLLEEQDDEIRSERWTDLNCVAAEALLFHCHDGEKGAVHVGEVALTASTILKGRGETVELGSRALGEKVRSFGLSAKRDSRGYRILLTEAVRRRIHELARDLRVPSAQDGVARCRHCAEHAKTEDQEVGT